jgi:hypothetical protein
MYSTPLFLSDFNEAELSRQTFEKYRNIKFHENPSSESRVVACERMGKRTDRETNNGIASRSSQFCEGIWNLIHFTKNQLMNLFQHFHIHIKTLKIVLKMFCKSVICK